MEGTKYDAGKPRWDLVPTEYFVKMSESIRPFIEVHMLKDGKLVFDRMIIYNMVKAMILRWKMMGMAGLLGRHHPLMYSLIGILMLAKTREYAMEEVFVDSEFPQRWDLIDPEWTRMLVEIYSHGAEKYEDNNWQKVASDRYYSALNRHLDKHFEGKTYDEDSGYKHLYHAAWNCIALMWLEKNIEVKDIPEPLRKTASNLARASRSDFEVEVVLREPKKKSVKKKATKKKKAVKKKRRS